MTSKQRFLACLFATLGIGLTVAPDVLAIIGRPMTPMSVAGVARRTTRRTVLLTQ